MSQSYDHHAEDYEPYEGHPDGRDLYDSYMERTMKPSLDEQMSSPEFRLSSIEMWIHNWTPRIQQMEKDIAEIKQQSVSEEMPENQKQAAWDALCAKTLQLDNQEEQFEEELSPDFWEQPGPATLSFSLANGTIFEMKFPDMESAIKFREGMR